MEIATKYKGIDLVAKVSQDVVFLTKATKNNITVPTIQFGQLQNDPEVLKVLRAKYPCKELNE